MTELNGSGLMPVPKGGVLLQSRQMHVTLSQENEGRLKILAAVNGTTPHAMLDFITEQGISMGWMQLLAGKLFFLCAHWVTWAV